MNRFELAIAWCRQSLRRLIGARARRYPEDVLLLDDRLLRDIGLERRSPR